MKAADVIVVGGGPSGVAAALELRRRGIEKVVILDRENHLGGATRHCSHSPFGMREFRRVYFGSAYGARLEHEAHQAGVQILASHTVVQLGDHGQLVVTSPRGVETWDAKRIVVATGAREQPRSTRMLSGDRPIGVVTTGTLQSCLAFQHLMPFRQPVIVGSELVSMSAVLTCLRHGARPVAVLESREHALARAPLSWFPSALGIPFHRGAEIVDIMGRGRVEAVTVRRQGMVETIACDGLLLTGQFTPESSLFLQSSVGVDPGSQGPAVDQDGRTMNPFIFASGNVLRGVETGGWAFREGCAVGAAVACDLAGPANPQAVVAVSFAAPIKLVVPSLLRRIANPAAALGQFQLRVTRRVRGRLALRLDGQEVWSQRQRWLPERRILVPMPAAAAAARAVQFSLEEEAD